MNKKLISISKFLSFVLRHKPEEIGVNLDKEGWIDILALMAASAKADHAFSRAELDEVVGSNDKKRFTISADGLRIRAAQGHSTDQVKMQMQEKRPPHILYHGTAKTNISSIASSGLHSGGRHHVHLSDNQDTAKSVGTRHGTPVVLKIAAEDMHQRGYKFFLSDNGVWLTDNVPAVFILNIKNP